MATNPFGFGPMGLPSKAPEEPAAKKARIDSLAIKTSVPANVLLALEERGENVETRASEIASQIGAGKRLEEVIDPETMGRAYDIADALYPRAAEPGPAPEKSEPGVAGDMRRQFTGALVRGVGGMADAVGSAADIYADGGIKLDPKESVAGKVARAVGAEIADYGSSIQAGVSEASKQAIAESTPDGDILDPSTWTFGEAPSLRGYAMLGADVMGSFLPVVATAVVTKSPTAAAAVGGAQGGGAAAQAARDAIEEMASTPHADGGTVLDHESNYFRELIAAGVPRDEAIRRTTRAAEHTAFLMTTPVSAFGGAATGKIIAPGIGALTGKGIATRAAGTAAASALEEGAQEAMEGVATKAGINAGAGADLSLTEGTFADFILGAMGGGPVGAASGAMNRETRGDGSAAGEAGTSEIIPPGSGAEVPATEQPEVSVPTDLPGQEGGQAIEGPLAPPAGPISEIAALAPDLTPLPETPPPAPKFPDYKPGDAARLVDPETGVIHDAVFLGETPSGVAVRIGGGEVEIDAAAFDQARVAAAEADESAKGKPARAKKLDVPQPSARPTPPATPGVDDAAAEALREQGFYDLPAEPPRSTLVDPKDLTPGEALKRARIVEDTAKRGGWTPRLKKKHAEFMAIAGEITDAPGTALPDVVGASQKVDAQERAGDKGRGQSDASLAADGRAASARGAASDQAGVVPDGGAADKSAPVAPAQADLFSAPAEKKRNRQEWDRFLDIAENGRGSSDAALEGREVLIRGSRVIIRAKTGAPSPLDFRLDATDMDRDTIASEVRFALDDLARRSPLPVPPPSGGAAPVKPPAAEAAAAAGMQNPKATSSSEPEPVAPASSADDWKQHPTFVANRKALGQFKKGMRVEFDAEGPFKMADGTMVPRETRRGVVTNVDRRSGQGTVSVLVDGGVGGNGFDVHIGAAKLRMESDPAPADKTSTTTKSVVASEPAPEARQAKPSGLLSALSDEKQARAEELKAKLAAKARNQVSSGLDPEYITLGGELVKLYLEAGVKRFGQMLRDFAETTGLTLKQAQEPMRAAYNHVRDNMDLEGKDTAGMDDAAAVLEEARAAIKGDTPPPAPPPGDKPSPTIEDIREKAAILRGIPKDQAPEIEGVSLKWDDRDGGFIFSRKHRDKVEVAVDAMQAPALAPTGRGESALPVQSVLDQKPENRVLSYTEVLGDSQAAKTLRSEPFENLSRNAQGVVISHVVGSLDDKEILGAVIKAIPVDVMNMLIGEKVAPEALARHPSMLTSRLPVPRDVAILKPVFAFINELVAAAKGGLAVSGAKDAGLNAGAGVVDFSSDGNTTGGAVSGDYWHGEFLGNSGSVHVNASPKQREAENYQVISADWNGIKLSLESPKGTVRRGYRDDGTVAWEVKMPADYGRILGTTGADGDHVDFYMGPYPQEETVYVVDQKDAETGAFDEHKVMLGFRNQKAALEAYFAGFSDGKGPQRKMAVTPMGYVDLILNLKNNPGIWKGPISNTSAAPEPKPKAPPAAKKSDGGADRPMDLEKLRAADFNAWDSQTREDGQKSQAKRLGRDETGRWARIEEVRYAEETAKAGSNHFAEIDTKGRNLNSATDEKSITGQFQFQSAGRTYASEWGAPAGRRRISGTDIFGEVAYFEAEDMDSGNRVIVEAIRPPKPKDGPEPAWQVENVYDYATDGSLEMRSPAGGDDASGQPAAILTGDELGEWSDMVDLQRRAQQWYRDNLQGSTVTNVETGWEIRFTRAGAGKVRGKPLDYLLRAVPGLSDIVAGASLIGSDTDRRGREHIKAVHHLRAEVSIGGRTEPVYVVIREMDDGRKFYDLNLGGIVGARTEDPKDARDYRVEPDAKVSADTLNIRFATLSDKPTGGPDAPAGWGEVEADPEITEADIMAITREMNAELARSGLAGKANVRVVRELYSRVSGAPIMGRASATKQDGAVIEVKAGASAGERGVMRHEIIHVLRSEALWNRKGGLFTEAEWRELAAAARAEPGIVKSVAERYPNLDRPGQVEEMVAELYRLWMDNRDGYSAAERALLKIEGFLTALANLFRGKGFVSAAQAMDQIATGKVGRRGPQGPGGPRNLQKTQRSQPAEMIGGALPRAVPSKFKGLVGSGHWKAPGKFLSDLLTDAMGRNARFNVLSLVPGDPLFTELGKRLDAAQEYVGLKRDMDADRNRWQARAAGVVDKWTAAARKNPEANANLMALMHETTLAGIDPSIENGWQRMVDAEADRVTAQDTRHRQEWASDVKAERVARQKVYASLQERFRALPKEFQSIYQEVRGEYAALADAVDTALVENIRAQSRITIKRADREYKKEMARIRDEGLTGQERMDAIGKANEKRAKAHARAARGEGSRVKQLRQLFEKNRLQGPYFPLARFGNFFVTIRDAEGRVVSFSRFETAREQRAWSDSEEAKTLGRVEIGVLGTSDTDRQNIDPRFIADIEGILEEAGADRQTMDQVYQRWLETLPDQSIRTAQIHRKGRAGFNTDAIRAFSSAMFHGAHQTARLRFGAEMEESLEAAEEQARQSDDPNRMGFVVREMKQRHAFTMQPTNNPWVSKATGLAFVWYLGMSPAAAMVNLSQTTVVGVPMMAAKYRKAGVTGSIRALTLASRDFMRGQGKNRTDTWSAENAKTLTADERRAMKQGYDRGVIDKTQAHDLASVADSGVEYNPVREKVMRIIGFAFHHAERFNREVTYLAAYRLAREEGMSHDVAVSSAASMVWRTHFDYSNTSKPRAMQGDTAKVFLIFRNFQVNMLWRLFRDTHQSLRGATPEERAEARAQLIGITLSMMGHAGIRGVWGYGLIMGLLSLFFPGDSDDLDEWLQDALLMEGDDPLTASWNFLMGMALNGVPGHALGVDLTNRIGMPELWFRAPDKDLEGKDLWAFYLEQLAGPFFGIAGNMFTGASQIMDGQFLRGAEKMVPTFVRNTIKTGRYATEGVTTYYGDDLVDGLNPWQLLMQLSGFSPAEVAEQYEINNRLKRREKRIEDERKDLHRAATDALRDGSGVPASVMEKIRDFNRRHPEYPITGDTIKKSLQGRLRASARNESGVSLNPKLNDRLRGELAPSIY